MPYITREDGQHFVIPSYRDVLTVKQKSQLKKDILLLGKSYGEYITLQKKAAQQYEVAFSSDTGYLLGESIWQYFKKPQDLIYCEAIPNTTEAILVIVKAGSVYLDGSFPLDSIPEELIIFLTQQNNFEIYTYGDVPISKEAETGKFSFEPASVKSFTVLDKPVFPKLPLLKVYQLKLADTVLKEQGIGIFPAAKLLLILILLGAGFGIYELFFTAPPPPPPEQVPNPYQAYFDLMSTAAPDEELSKMVDAWQEFLTIEGWSVNALTYASGTLSAKIVSQGGSMQTLYAWADEHKATVTIEQNGISIAKSFDLSIRPLAENIYSTQKVLALVIDRIAPVLPGNVMTLNTLEKKAVYSSAAMTISLSEVSPMVLDLIGKKLTGLPLVLRGVSGAISDNGLITGRINIDVLGS